MPSVTSVRVMLVVSIIIIGAFFSLAFLQPPGSSDNFQRLPATQTDPNGNSVSGNCGGTFDNASASLSTSQEDGASQVTISVKKTRPNTFYTVWLRLKGTDSNDNAFGGSPLTGGGSTPLAPTTELPNLLAATGSGNGNASVANGFWTNGQGNGNLSVNLDFPIVDGNYPFQRFPNFNPSDPNFPVANPAIFPVAIVWQQTANELAPFTLRIVSHCLDDVGHGLTPGMREPWFDYP